MLYIAHIVSVDIVYIEKKHIECPPALNKSKQNNPSSMVRHNYNTIHLHINGRRPIHPTVDPTFTLVVSILSSVNLHLRSIRHTHCINYPPFLHSTLICHRVGFQTVFTANPFQIISANRLP